LSEERKKWFITYMPGMAACVVHAATKPLFAVNGRGHPPHCWNDSFIHSFSVRMRVDSTLFRVTACNAALAAWGGDVSMFHSGQLQQNLDMVCFFTSLPRPYRTL
jgi:hypothetical protein